MTPPLPLRVVRDFTLKLEENGKPITARQYAENALRPQSSYTDAALRRNQIRGMLSTLFTDRDCHTLVRPVSSEEDLRKLHELPPSALREEFVQAVGALRASVFDRAPVKRVMGKTVDGRCVRAHRTPSHPPVRAFTRVGERAACWWTWRGRTWRR